MIKALRRSIANTLRAMADKISDEPEPKHSSTHLNFTEEEIDQAWRIAARKVLGARSGR